MGTKNNPGQWDCYAKAAMDEPIFTLRAKDPIAPHLVRAWRFLRADKPTEAMACILNARRELLNSEKPILSTGDEKSIEAEDCAAAMERWRAANLPG